MGRALYVTLPDLAFPVTSDRVARIIEDADRCVKCAVCLPYCPTYLISGNEAESPRGRIALMRALADGSQAPNPGMTQHLDQCLTCRNCEPVCPAQVPYGRLVDNARAELARNRPTSRLKRLGLRLVLRRGLVRWLSRALWVLQVLRLGWLAPPASRLGSLQAPRPWRAHEPAGVPARGTVGLFVGCVADPLDVETRESAARVLAASGYRVRLPPDQACCGALHQHAGDPERARAQAEANRQCFNDQGLDTVISTATGCGAQLAEHVFPAARHADVCAFLAGNPGFDALRLQRLSARVAVHVPCTQRNVLRDTESVSRLLARIPGLTVEAVAVPPRCCGAAGSYVLEHSGIADRLGRELAEQVARDAPDYLATANIGCALHLADHFRRLGAPTEVLHPVSLVARQLR